MSGIRQILVKHMAWSAHYYQHFASSTTKAGGCTVLLYCSLNLFFLFGGTLSSVGEYLNTICIQKSKYIKSPKRSIWLKYLNTLYKLSILNTV